MKYFKCLAGESESVEPQQGVFRQLLRLLWEHESEAVGWANTLTACTGLREQEHRRYSWQRQSKTDT